MSDRPKRRPTTRGWSRGHHRAWFAVVALAIVLGHTLQVWHFATHVHGVDENGIEFCSDKHPTTHHGTSDREGDGDEGEGEDDEGCPFVPPGLLTAPALPTLVQSPTAPPTEGSSLPRIVALEPPIEILRFAPKQSPPTS